MLSISHSEAAVTGAGSGLGRAAAIALAHRGLTVYALGRRDGALEETATLAAAAPGRVLPIRCDCTDDAAVSRAFDAMHETGHPTALVHAAAQVQKMPARRMSAEQFRAVVESTLVSSFITLRNWALPLIDLGRSGSAVMVTSNSASRGTPGVAHSSAGKAGVEALVKSLAREWGPYGLSINALGPGVFPVEKSMTAWSTESVRSRMHDAIALGRYGRLPEIVGPILFLLSDAASYVTGERLRVDGGLGLTRWSVTEEEITAGVNNQYMR